MMPDTTMPDTTMPNLMMANPMPEKPSMADASVAEPQFIADNAFIGDVGHGFNWAGFSHRNSVSTVGYALLQFVNGTYTLINKRSGGGFIGFRVDNADKMIINDSGSIGIGTTTPSRQLHMEGSEIHSGGGGAGFSFGNRQTAGFVNIPANGERWVWYSSTS